MEYCYTSIPFYRVPAPPFWWVLKFKVFALLGLWVKRFASSPSGWSSFMSFWFSSSFGVPLATVLSRPFSFDPGALPPFYSSLLFAWCRLNGSFSTSHNSLAVGVGSPLPYTPVVGVSTWSCYLYLLNLCKFFIWQSRNDFHFRNVPPGAVDIIAKVKARLKCHLPIFFKRFQSSRRHRYFHHQWGARGVIASVSGNALSIVL